VEVDQAFSTLLLKALGQRIRELRAERGYSQESFADKCGVHRTFMGTVERGESNLSFQNIARVAITLDVTLSNLFLGLEPRARALGAQSPKPASVAPWKRKGGTKASG
jgi:transcriptional regulator with XRE-family HTH domain